MWYRLIWLLVVTALAVLFTLFHVACHRLGFESTLAERARRKLAREAGLEKVRARVDHLDLILEGQVASASLKTQAQTIADQVPGLRVLGSNNHLAVLIPHASCPPREASADEQQDEILLVVYFDNNSARLTASEAAKLRAFKRVDRILGHADDRGDTDDNHRLSLKRAQAVEAMLQRQGCLVGDSAIQALGEQFTVGDPTEEGRRLSRRVEIGGVGIKE